MKLMSSTRTAVCTAAVTIMLLSPVAAQADISPVSDRAAGVSSSPADDPSLPVGKPTRYSHGLWEYIKCAFALRAELQKNSNIDISTLPVNEGKQIIEAWC